MATILLVDDEAAILKVLRTYLERTSEQSYDVLTAMSAEEALPLVKSRDIDLMIVDLRLGKGMDGLELLHHCHALKCDLPVIMITAYGTIEVAVQAMKEGAYDFIAKPFDMKEIMQTVESALTHQETADVTGEDASSGGPPMHFGSLVGESDAMQKVYKTIERVAPTDASILILGESGTGKELVARSPRQKSDNLRKSLIKNVLRWFCRLT